MVADVEGRTIHPQRPAEPAAGLVENLAEPREQVQPCLDGVTRRLDPEAAVRPEQVPGVEDRQGANVLGPHRVGPEDQSVVGRQTIEHHRRSPSGVHCPPKAPQQPGPIAPARPGTTPHARGRVSAQG
jgi:hypothetical protein